MHHGGKYRHVVAASARRERYNSELVTKGMEWLDASVREGDSTARIDEAFRSNQFYDGGTKVSKHPEMVTGCHSWKSLGDQEGRNIAKGSGLVHLHHCTT
jgi:hypothetical protein